MQIVSITGANSFIGRHLIEILSSRDDIKIKAMISNSIQCALNAKHNVSLYEADLLKAETLQGFVEKGGTVINLAYLRKEDSSVNLHALENLLDQCEKAKIKRFIHCSTAVVAGRVNVNAITEKTTCNPVTEYEKTKLLLEDILLRRADNKFESVILRPTAVFGAGGKNLLKLAETVCYGNKLTNYLRSCVYDHRKMNLVYVANVVSAIEFMIRAIDAVDKQVFIISDDENACNNYRDVEKYFIDKLGCKDHSIPRIVLHPIIIKLLLFTAGRSQINSDQIYDCRKLTGYGFRKPVDFMRGLDEFIAWYQQHQNDRSGDR